MTCCGLERDSQFCPKCGKKLVAVEGPIRWVKASKNEMYQGVQITVYPDRHRIAVTKTISDDEAKLLRDELTGILGE